MADMFNAPVDQQADPNVDYLSELVGDDKKFKTTAELARGKYEADKHIENLTNTLNELRNDLKTRTTEEDLINRITQLQTRQSEQRQEPTQTENPTTATGLTKEDVERMFAERDTQRTSASNLQEVQTRLAEMYGNTAPQEIEAKAKELGVSKDELRSMAASRPKVFLALFTERKAQPLDVFGAPTSGRATPLDNNVSGVKKFSDFQKLRREKPTEYFGPAVQKEILAIGDRLGGPGNPAYEKWRNS